jgi:hypothetical protein
MKQNKPNSKALDEKFPFDSKSMGYFLDKDQKEHSCLLKVSCDEMGECKTIVEVSILHFFCFPFKIVFMIFLYIILGVFLQSELAIEI